MRWWWLGAWIPMLGACQASPQIGTSCARSVDCDAPLVCGFGRCRAQCREQRDCPLGALCLLDEAGIGSCALPSDPDCRTTGSSCPTGLACIGGECVNACATVTDCPPGSVCIPVGDRTRCERADVLGIDAGDLDAGDLDAGDRDAPQSADASDPGDATGCPFGDFMPLDDVNVASSGGESDPTLSRDGLYLWWFTGLHGNYYATRSTRFGTFGPGTEHRYLGNFSVELFDDGLSMVAFNGDLMRLVQQTRASRAVEFTDHPVEIGQGLQIEEPTVDESGLHLVAMMGTTAVKSSRASTGVSFDVPTPIGELASYGVTYPSLSGDGLTLAYAHGGTIYLVDRPTLDGSFGTPVRFRDMDGVSEEDPHLSRDGLELYVSSMRGGSRQLWVSRRTCTP